MKVSPGGTARVKKAGARAPKVSPASTRKKATPKKAAKPKRNPVKKTAHRGASPDGGQQLGLPMPGADLETREPEPSLILDRRLLLPKKVCALALGVSVQSMEKWKVKPREKHGREVWFYLPDLIEHRLDRETTGRLSLTDERARLAKLQADKTELEVKELKGELIPAALVLATWEPIAGAARAKVLAIPSKLKTAIPKLTEKDITKAKTIARGVLEDLANSGIPKNTRSINRAAL